jgi:surface antigen
MKSIKAATLSALLLSVVLAGCTTSGPDRLDQTGQDISNRTGLEITEKVESPAYYIQALNGGLVGRVAGLKLSAADRARALEAEYKALESSPNGQTVVWQGAGLKGEVTAATPYQVGSQNCRQYTHTVTSGTVAPAIARGAACRNPNGSWTPLT